MAGTERTETSGAAERVLIERGLQRIRDEAQLSLTFWGRVGHDGNRLHLDVFSGQVLGALRGLSVGFGTGIGGRAASVGRPMAVDNYVGAERITHHYDHVIRAERLQSVLAIPIVVGRNVKAVMYGATRDSASLGGRALRLAADGARDLEQQLAVHTALGHHVSTLRADVRGAEAPSSADWETVRTTFARLRVLASQCEDPTMQRELSDLAESLNPHPEPGAPGPSVHLTAREIDVLACVAQGLTNAEIAGTLGLGPETVKSYLRSSMRRLGAGTRWGAVVEARRAGLLP